MKLYKKMTKSGAVGIPVKFRRDAGLLPGDGVSVEEIGGKLIIVPQEKRCIFCGQTETEIQEEGKKCCSYWGKVVCSGCLGELEGRMDAPEEGGADNV